MNKNAVDILNGKGVNLIVTVDNGIAANEEIAYAKTLGIETVVTDHHTPLKTIPDAVAVVDLHQKDCKSKFKQLSGVGVAFKLIMALEGEYCSVDALLDNYADLLSLGTIGDIVDLRGENRVFVKRGLESLKNTDRPGMVAEVTAALARHHINIAQMVLFRNKKGEDAVMVVETDQKIPAQEIAALHDQDGILKVTYIDQEDE